MYVADLVGNKEVSAKNTAGVTKKKTVRDIRSILKPKGFQLALQGKSKIWKRSAERVQEMINKIEMEKANPLPGFALVGSKSIFSSNKEVQHSCITWAIEKLRDSAVFIEPEKSSFLYTNTSIHANQKPNSRMQQPTGFAKMLNVLFWNDDFQLI